MTNQFMIAEKAEAEAENDILGKLYFVAQQTAGSNLTLLNHLLSSMIESFFSKRQQRQRYSSQPRQHRPWEI